MIIKVQKNRKDKRTAIKAAALRERGKGHIDYTHAWHSIPS